MLFGVSNKRTGTARINKVVSHFQDMLDDLEKGSLEIKADMAANQESVKELQDEIAGIKAGNTKLGAAFDRAACIQRSISAIVNDV